MRIMHMSRAAETLRWFMIPVMRMQQDAGHYVCICTAAASDVCVEKEDLSDVQYLQNEGFDVFTHGMRRNLNPLLLLKAMKRVRKLLIEHEIDVIICHNPLGAIIGRLAARLAKVPCVIYFAHGLPCAPQQGKIEWAVRYTVEKFLGRFTDAILVMNNYDEQLCRNHRIIKNPDKIIRIPGMGVDLSKFSAEQTDQLKGELAEELGINREDKIVISVARLILEKGVKIYLEAARQVCRERNDVCFLLIGNGPLMGVLGKYIKENKLGDRVKLLGWLNDVTRFVKAADIFALPTYYNEGLPVSILEAMSCGKPVIATRHRGCEDAVVDGQSGILVPVKRPDVLAEKIIYLLDNESLRREMGMAARRRIEEIFELGLCTKKIVDALEKAMD